MSGSKRPTDVYLIFGDDDYLVEQHAAKAIARIRQEVGDDAVVDSLDCKAAGLEGVIEELLTPSLFSLNKVTVLRHFRLTAENKLAREIEKSIASGLAPGQFLVIVADKVDKRLKLTKLVDAKGGLDEVKKGNHAQLRDWISERFTEEGKSVSPGVPDLLLDLKGEDLRSLDSEIEKIVTYVGDGKNVTEKELQALVGRSRIESVFELIRYVIEGKAGNALETITDLLDAGESGPQMVSRIGRAIRWLIQVKLFLRTQPGLWDQGMAFPEFSRTVIPRFKVWVESNHISEGDTFLYQKPFAIYMRFKESQACDLRDLLEMLDGLLAANKFMISMSVHNKDKVALEIFVSALGR
ncbi:MAG: DNA polymerase III subunit delta [Candidatus Eisenbacteria bacterium]